jgi:hypothetical protein
MPRPGPLENNLRWISQCPIYGLGKGGQLRLVLLYCCEITFDVFSRMALVAMVHQYIFF